MNYERKSVKWRENVFEAKKREFLLFISLMEDAENIFLACKNFTFSSFLSFLLYRIPVRIVVCTVTLEMQHSLYTELTVFSNILFYIVSGLINGRRRN
jgi:hypothetical protein